MTLQVFHRDQLLTQEQLEAIVSVMNANMNGEIGDGEAYAQAIDKALEDAGLPVPKEKNHRNFLVDLITGLEKAGFTNIRVSDVDLGVVRLDEGGIDNLVDNILGLDDTLPLSFRKEDVGKASLYLYCGNAPWETVMDAGFSTREMEEAVNQVLHPIERGYMA